MDSLTQIALGIAVAEVCAGKKLKNKTFLYGAILGTLPDLDITMGQVFKPSRWYSDTSRYESFYCIFLILIANFGLAHFKNRKGKN